MQLLFQHTVFWGIGSWVKMVHFIPVCKTLMRFCVCGMAHTQLNKLWLPWFTPPGGHRLGTVLAKIGYFFSGCWLLYALLPYHWLCVALLHLLRSTSFLGHHLLDSSHSQEMHNNFNKSPLRIYHAQEFRNAKWRKFGCWWRFVVLVYEFSSFTHWGKILKRLFSKVSNLHLQKSRS